MRKNHVIRDEAPRGMWRLIGIRTGRTRAQVLYQIKQMPDIQDLEVIHAVKEILKVITGEVFGTKKQTYNPLELLLSF